MQGVHFHSSGLFMAGRPLRALAVQRIMPADQPVAPCRNWRLPIMQLIDLSREIYHRTQVHPSHPPVVMSVWNDHSEIKKAGNTEFSSQAMAISLSDHSCTHVDAPVHFDPRPDAPSAAQTPPAKFSPGATSLNL